MVDYYRNNEQLGRKSLLTDYSMQELQNLIKNLVIKAR